MKATILLTLLTVSTLCLGQNYVQIDDSGTPNKFKNKSAPTFKSETLDNQVVELEQFKGKIVFLHFWSLNCSLCFKELPELNEIAKKYPKDKFVILSLMDNSREQLLAKFDSVGGVYKMKKPVYGNDRIDFQIVPGAREIMKLYSDQPAFPQTFILDQSGIMTFSFEGYSEKRGIPDEVVITDLFIKEIDRLMNASR